jgi:hypothetical protein
MIRHILFHDQAPNTDDRNRLEYGFARALAQDSTFNNGQILALARTQQADVPAHLAGQVDRARLQQERLLMLAADGVPFTPPSELQGDDRRRAEAIEAFVDERYAEVLSAWTGEAVSPMAQLLLLEAAARAGAPDQVRARLGPVRQDWPADARFAAAQTAARHDAPDAAVEHLREGFTALRQQVWARPQAVQAALSLVGPLVAARELIDDGAIGEPVGATAFMMSGGPESWHPNPFFFYEVGAGPLFDMGPYYLTALVNLLGPIAGVSALARKSFPERIATSEAHYGRRIPVHTPTHVASLLDFDAGPVGTMITSFDINGGSQLPRIEVYGSEGTLSVPDPNTFTGPVWLKRAGEKEWQEVPLTHSPDVGRGIGVADMAYAIRSGRPHRASGELAYHVLENMEALLKASAEGRYMAIESTCARPQALPVGLQEGSLDN